MVIGNISSFWNQCKHKIDPVRFEVFAFFADVLILGEDFYGEVLEDLLFFTN